ncbi:hypothetical protein Tco_0853762, partial [Tanacetum coccineum]
YQLVRGEHAGCAEKLQALDGSKSVPEGTNV